MTYARRPGSTRRSKARGVALIEALIGILIFAFGIIGLVGLQVAMTRAQGATKYRSDAANLGSQVLGLMWADQTKLVQYDTANCASYVPCKDWKQKVVDGLPAGNADLTVSTSGTVVMTITWSTPAEGTHSHVLLSQIR